MKKKYRRLMMLGAAVLLILLAVVLIVDYSFYLAQPEYSTPFSFYVAIRSITFLVPSVILMVAALISEISASRCEQNGCDTLG